MTKPIFDNAKERGTQDKIGQLNPLKRAGQPHELARWDCFSPAMTRPMSTVSDPGRRRPHRLDAVCGQAG